VLASHSSAKIGKKFKDYFGKFYFLSEDQYGRIANIVEFTDEGLIKGDYHLFYKLINVKELPDSKIRWKTKFGKSYICLNYEDKQNEKWINFRIEPQKNSFELYKNEPVSTFYYNEYYSSEINSLPITKSEELIKKYNENLKIEQNAILKKLPKNFNKGKFGGGYGDTKWGMSSEEVINLMKDKIPLESKKADYLSFKSDDVTADFYFFYDLLYKVELTTKINNEEDAKNIKNKYGKGKENSERFSDYDNKGNLNVWEIYEYHWSDSLTSIDMGRCEAIQPPRKAFFGVMLDICDLKNYQKEIIYKSIHLESLKKKMEESKKYKKNKNLY